MTDGIQYLTGYVVRDYDDLIVRLANSRKAQRISQREVAERMRCLRIEVSRWLLGNVEARSRAMFALVDALGYDLALIPRGGEAWTRADSDALLRDAVAAMGEDAPRGAAISPQTAAEASGVGRYGIGPSEAISGPPCECAGFHLAVPQSPGPAWCECGHERAEHVEGHGPCQREAVMLG